MGYVSNAIIGLTIMAASATDFAYDSPAAGRVFGAAKNVIHSRQVSDEESLISRRKGERIVDGVLFFGGALYTAFSPRKKYVRMRDRK